MENICLTYANDNNIDKTILDNRFNDFIYENIQNNNYKLIDNTELINIKNNISLSALSINNTQILIPVVIYNKSGTDINDTFANNFIDSINNYYRGNDSDYENYSKQNFIFNDQNIQTQFQNMINLKSNINVLFYLKSYVNTGITIDNWLGETEPDLPSRNNLIKKTNNTYDVPDININKCLSIWLVKNMNFGGTQQNPSYNILGYAQLPYYWWYFNQTQFYDISWSYYDGVVICYDTINNQSGDPNFLNNAKNKSIVHELGHWLGLLH